MSGPATSELAREYRVAKQTLGMHSSLRDRYARLGLSAEVILLLLSTGTSATTFAGEELYRVLHMDPIVGRLSLGILSVVAFGASLVMLVVDPRGRCVRHEDAVRKWWGVVDRFRRSKREDDTWPEEIVDGLSRAYGEACENSAPIPDRGFNSLKAQYLRKVELSRLRDTYPACPTFVLVLLMRGRDTIGAIRGFRRGVHDQSSDPKSKE